MERNKTIDSIKGIAIILVVLGHAYAPFINFISLFHMAIFFIVSGYCWNNSKVQDFKSLMKYVLRKLKTLYIPFVLFNGACVLLNNFFIKINFYTSNTDLLLWENSPLVVSRFLEFKYPMGVTETIKSLIKVLLFSGETQFGGATWFLRTLFIVAVFHAIFEFIFKKAKVKKIIFILINIICIIFSQIISQYDLHMHFGLQNVFLAYYMYSIGMILKDKKILENKKINNKIVLVCSFIISFAILVYLSMDNKISFVDNKIVNILFFTFTSILGFIMLFSFSKIFNYFEKIFIYLGKRTIPIILFHFLSFKVVTIIYLIHNNKPLYLLAAFPCLIDNYLWILYTIIGVVLPLAIYEIYSKIKKWRLNYGKQ